MVDRNTAELRQHQANEDAQEAKWQAYGERARQMLADEFFSYQGAMGGPCIWTLLDKYSDDPIACISDNGDFDEYREAIAARNWNEVGRIQGRAFERIARQLAESETFADRLAEIVNQLDEDGRHE